MTPTHLRSRHGPCAALLQGNVPNRRYETDSAPNIDLLSRAGSENTGLESSHQTRRLVSRAVAR